MSFMFYLEKRRIVACNMLDKLYSRFLKTRFTEDYRRMKKTRKTDNFLYIHFNPLIILLVIFLFRRWERFYMMIILLKDIGIISGMN